MTTRPLTDDDDATRTVALVIHGLRHFCDPDGQCGRHRPADPNCRCKPEPVAGQERPRHTGPA